MNPLQTLENWLQQAHDAGSPLAGAMTLATVAEDGSAAARTVLHKEVDGEEIVFGTSLSSRKGRELLAEPRVALVYLLAAQGRQIRVTGTATPADEATSEALWRARGRDSRLVSSLSDQGRPLPGGLEPLRERFARADAELGDEPPRPEDWTAIRVRVETIEFWSEGERRLAEREEWRRDPQAEGGWTRRWLEP